MYTIYFNTKRLQQWTLFIKYIIYLQLNYNFNIKTKFVFIIIFKSIFCFLFWNSKSSPITPLLPIMVSTGQIRLLTKVLTTATDNFYTFLIVSKFNSKWIQILQKIFNNCLLKKIWIKIFNNKKLYDALNCNADNLLN